MSTLFYALSERGGFVSSFSSQTGKTSQVKFPGSRTRAVLVHRAKALIFDTANFQAMIDLREKHALEDSMGFRGQFDEHRRFQIEMLKSQGLLPSHSFLEVGCGPLTVAIPVIDYLDRGNYVGIDVRSSVLNLGWREIGKASLSEKNPNLICSNDFGNDALSPDRRFDFIYSFSVLYHLSDDILDRYFAAVSNRLKPTGTCLANVNEHVPSDRWLEFPFEKRPMMFYEAAAARHSLKTTLVGTCKELGFRHVASIESSYPVLRFTTGN